MSTMASRAALGGRGAREGVSIISKNDLKCSLLQLECHFTWLLLTDEVDLDTIEDKMGNQLEFLAQSTIASYNMLSYVCHLKHLNEDALENLRKAEKEIKTKHADDIERRSLVTWGNYAWIYYYMNKYEEVQTYLRKVEDTCKKLSSTARFHIQLPEIYSEKGWALLQFGKISYCRAKESFKSALEKEPDNPEFNVGYAIALYRWENNIKGKDESETSTLKALRRAVELSPNDTSVAALLALKLQELDLVDEGESYIKEAMDKTPDFPYFLRYAAIFYRKKREFDKSLELLRKSLAITPKCCLSHHQMGLCYRAKLFQLKMKKYPPREQMEEFIRLAIFHFERAVEYKSTFFFAYGDLAGMYAEGKQYREAEATFQKVFEMTNLHPRDKQYLHNAYGNYQLFHRKSESEAIKHFTEGLKIEEDCLSREKCKHSLQKLLEQRIRKGLGDAEAFSKLGFIHQLNNEKVQAIECYEKALDLDPENEEYLAELWKLQSSI